MDGNFVHFEVQLSVPYEYETNRSDSNGKLVSMKQEGMRNLTLDLLTSTATRAIELALQHHPGGEIHVVQRRGTRNLIVDPL